MKNGFLLGTALAVMAFSFGAQAAGKKAAAPRHQAEPSYERPVAAAARGGHNMAGCGLGSMVIQENSKWSQVGAAFLNGTGFQTFGISFGTSNCTEDGVASASREKDAFVEANLSDIRRDLSVGSGEYLSALASFYGCKGEQVGSFGSALHKHYDKVQAASPEKASGVIDTAVVAEKASCQG